MARTALLTYADLERFPHDHRRRELIGGELIVTPSPTPAHQETVGSIFIASREYALRHGGRAFVSPVDVVFGQRDVAVPDVVYVAADRLDTIAEKALVGAPSLAVEVLSPSTSSVDRKDKRALYARHGVAEYWIVDAERRSIERCSRPQGDAYADSEAFSVGIMLAASLPGLSIRLDDAFVQPPA